MEAEKASWAQAGIQVNLSTATFNTVIGNSTPCKGSSCKWEFENWAGARTYAPDYYPTGGVLLPPGDGPKDGA